MKRAEWDIVCLVSQTQKISIFLKPLMFSLFHWNCVIVLICSRNFFLKKKYNPTYLILIFFFFFLVFLSHFLVNGSGIGIMKLNMLFQTAFQNKIASFLLLSYWGKILFAAAQHLLSIYFFNFCFKFWQNCAN